MANRFHDTGTGMAKKHSRRGMFRLVGAGVLGVTAAAMLPAVASADSPFTPNKGLWFATVNGQNFNILQPWKPSTTRVIINPNPGG